MYKNSNLAKSIRLALMFGGASLALTGTAAAQDQSEEEQAEEAQERITVTGSRITRTDYESASPVQITSSEEIKVSGFTKIEDLMNSLPQIEAAQTSYISNGATGTASLDLRGLGAERTLVLVNGRRLQSGGIYSESPDINQIPAALVERVEVMTGGGSATYGADAVAGVVNFVMKDDFEGVEIVAGTSGFQHNNGNSYIQGLMDNRNFDYPTGSSGIDGRQHNIDLTIGGEFGGGRGHATAYATWREVEELRQGARDYSSCALNGAGTACGGSATAPLPNAYFAPIVDGAYDGSQEVLWSLGQDGLFTPYDGTNVYNYAPVNHFMRPDTRYTLGAFVEYQVTDDSKAYLETSFMHNRTVAQIAESGVFFQSFTLDINNPRFSDAQRQQFYDTFGPDVEQIGTYIGKRNVEGGPRQNQLEHNTFRIVAGVEGYLSNNWMYDVNFQLGQASSSTAYVNDFYVPRIGQALGDVNSPECADGCIPYNVFTPGGVTAEAADALGGTAVMTGITTQRIVSGYLSGDLDVSLPGSDYPIAAVIGAESREVDFERTADEVYKLGQLSGQGGPTQSIAGGFNVGEIFGELRVPIVDGIEGVESLALELGARYSDYSSSGGESTYKVLVDYDPTDNLKIRASFNRAVRAPNVGDLFTGTSLGLWGGEDPCAGASPEFTAAQCANTGVTPDQYGNIGANPAGQYNGLFSGNLDLNPEIASTWTVGVVAQPTDNFNFSVDYYDIEIEDVITTLAPSVILEQCALTGEYCEKIVRAPSGSLWRGEEGYLILPNENLGGRVLRGVDLSTNYVDEDFAGGVLTAKVIGTYNLEKIFQPNTDFPEFDYDCSGLISTQCFAQPKWRHTLSLNYASDGAWSATAKWRYFGQVDYEGSTDTLLAGKGISAQSYIDLVGAYDVSENTSVMVGINNVFDKEPPMMGVTLSNNANTVAGFYDTLGRYIHASVTVRF